jgi:hypothetical protein
VNAATSSTYTVDDALSDLTVTNDTAHVTDITVGAMIDRLDPVDVRFLAVIALRDMARVIVRSKNAQTEREATRAERTPPPDEKLYRGKARHGTAPAYRSGCTCDDCSTMREAMDEANERASATYVERMHHAIEQYASDLRIEWTTELLATPFAIDETGVTVLWGQATVAQHERRIEMLAKSATATAQTAARHRAAVTALVGSGVGCLADLPRQD